MDKFGLTSQIINKLISIFSKENKIKKVILYGSRALGTFKNGSDIDLVIVSPKMSLSELLKIENLIEDLMLPYQIDLSVMHMIENEDLIDHIQKYGIVFYPHE